MPTEFESKALDANLEQTRTAEIKIPSRHSWFAALSEDHWGIHKRTEEFVQEYNHPYVNYSYIIENLHSISLTDLWFYNSLKDSEEALFFLAGLFEELLGKKLEEKQQEQLILTLFKFTDKLVHEEGFPLPVIQKCIRLIKQGLKDHEMIYLRNSSYFRTYFAELAAHSEFKIEIFALTRLILVRSCEYWRETTSAEEWLATRKELLQPIYQDKIRLISHDFFTALKANIENSKTWEELESNLFFNDIANHFRRFSDEFKLPIEKIHYLFYIMQVPGMLHLQNHILYDMNRLLKDALADMTGEETYSFIDTLFELFAELKEKHTGTILDCLLTLGKEIASANDQKIISYFTDRLIAFGFICPGDPEINSDWQIKVDINHVKNIRIWLELIEHSPLGFKKLLSALVVNLKLGGIFISDTDLFQRDITKLLNSDIDPVYKQVKQLAKFFPVYFGEIGAEGKLREATTAIDELSRRKDVLIHFVRKQIHTESNNTQIRLIESVMDYWYNGDRKLLLPLIPKDVADSLDQSQEYYQEIHELTLQICKNFQVDGEGLLTLPVEVVLEWLSALEYKNERDKKRLQYLLEIHDLLQTKYSLESGDILKTLNSSRFFGLPDIESLGKSLEDSDFKGALGKIFKIIYSLKVVILDQNESIPLETIYYKRHIAIGIPSMYGQYKEPKFEALGIIYRLEKVASSLMDELMGKLKLDYITVKSLNRIYDILHLFKTGLELDGIENQNFTSNLEMLSFSLKSPSFSLGQYVNIFQFMAQNIKEIINEYFLRVYDETLEIVVPQIFKEDKDNVLPKSEQFYREIMSSAFLIQQLDQFVTDCIIKLQNLMDNYTEKHINSMMHYNPDLTLSPFNKVTPEMDNRVFLSAKAYYLKKMTSYKFPIPPGFVLTTEVFRHRETVFEHPFMSLELEKIILRNVTEIERLSKLKFGSVKGPLLLSVRSGTAISLPGAMSTFLNVGMNDEIAEAMGKNPETAWMGWDSYRRFIQSWGMSNGINRVVFDNIMSTYKQKYSVLKKTGFEARQMKEIAYDYKKALEERDVPFSQDTNIQLRQAILNVMDSWDSLRAQSYRKYLQIADEWGTAVIVQKMVMGNRSKRSGSGVLFTHNPKLNKPGINLYGDYTLCSQGEDIVAGLVHTLPISDSQWEKGDSDKESSLQTAYPALFLTLEHYATELIERYGFNNQEIEFTFESEMPEDLYILQIREQIINDRDMISMFRIPKDEMKLAGRGIAIDGGCLSGIVSFSMADILNNRKLYPEKHHILIRPDTVPDDIPIIFLCDGLVTSRGGVTSHAAVTAAKLGKVCIVNCKELSVNDTELSCTINGQYIRSGDAISIDGKTGNVFMGSYPIDYLKN